MTRRRSGRWVGRTRELLIARDGAVCARCRRVLDLSGPRDGPLSAQVGHVLPLARGGTDDLGNLRLEHRACNIAAGARVPDAPAATVAPEAIFVPGERQPRSLLPRGMVPTGDYLRDDASKGG